MLPLRIESGVCTGGHCQGIAVDVRRRVVCFSFTTAFLVYSFDGKLIGSVEGLRGHLGCLALNPVDGRVYASLEYKRDAIGLGIKRMLGETADIPEAFYAAIFDLDKITSVGTPADKAMKCVYLKKAVADYMLAQDNAQSAHRYGCSGIDGITFAPKFGSKTGEMSLYIAYGIYSDINRDDNDHQILLRFNAEKFSDYAQPLSLDNMHTSGPDEYEMLFAYTGNTTYGIQNLEYDAFSDSMYMCVYRGKKRKFPNYPMYALDMTKPPIDAEIRGTNERGKLLTLKRGSAVHEQSGISGFEFAYGQTGLCAVGNGLYYVSFDEKTEGGWKSAAVLYKYDGTTPFVPASQADSEAF